MGRLSAFLLALSLGGASAVALASCGGGNDAKLLPGTTASQIESKLNEVDRLVAEGDCVGAEDATSAVSAEVGELREVAPKLKAALQEGAARLGEVVTSCEEAAGEETEPSPEAAVEAEELEEKKPKKEKPEKEPPKPDKEPPEGPELPPQSNGKGEEKGQGGPPAEAEIEEAEPSGGVGPGVEGD